MRLFRIAVNNLSTWTAKKQDTNSIIVHSLGRKEGIRQSTVNLSTIKWSLPIAILKFKFKFQKNKTTTVSQSTDLGGYEVFSIVVNRLPPIYQPSSPSSSSNYLIEETRHQQYHPHQTWEDRSCRSRYPVGR